MENTSNPILNFFDAPSANNMLNALRYVQCRDWASVELMELHDIFYSSVNAYIAQHCTKLSQGSARQMHTISGHICEVADWAVSVWTRALCELGPSPQLFAQYMEWENCRLAFTWLRRGAPLVFAGLPDVLTPQLRDVHCVLNASTRRQLARYVLQGRLLQGAHGERQYLMLYQIADRLADMAEFTTECRANATALGLCMTHLSQIKYFNGEADAIAEGPWLYLSTHTLVKQLQEWQAVTQQCCRAPTQLDPQAAWPATETLRILRWAEAILHEGDIKRKEERVDEEAAIRATFGFALVHDWIKRPGAIPVTQCELLNRSAKGVGFRIDSRAMAAPRIGELVGFRVGIDLTVHIGEIVRVKDAGSHFDIGVSLFDYADILAGEQPQSGLPVILLAREGANYLAITEFGMWTANEKQAVSHNAVQTALYVERESGLHPDYSIYECVSTRIV